MDQTYTLHAEGDGTPLATAEVRRMGEGDLLVGLRAAGAHQDDEKLIVLIAVEANGRYCVSVLDGDGKLIEMVEVA